nr:unnamed protein product [Callosobruchus chinensis]
MQDNHLINEVVRHSQDWFDSNELHLNLDKTETCVFSLINGTESHHVKFLGVHFDTCLSWNKHIEQLCTRLSRTVYAIKKIAYAVNSDAALTTYYGLFHSVMCYGILSWGSASHAQIQKVFLVQKAAMRGIIQANRIEHCQLIFQKLNVMTVYAVIIYENLRYIKRHKHMFKSFFEVHSHNTRNKNNLMQPRGRIEKTKLIGIDLYNLLPLSITNLPINLFERKIKTVLKQLAPYSINDFKIHLKDNAGL